VLENWRRARKALFDGWTNHYGRPRIQGQNNARHCRSGGKRGGVNSKECALNTCSLKGQLCGLKRQVICTQKTAKQGTVGLATLLTFSDGTSVQDTLFADDPSYKKDEWAFRNWMPTLIGIQAKNLYQWASFQLVKKVRT
jgi:hypothetical protein